MARTITPHATFGPALARVKETVHRRGSMDLSPHDILYEDAWLLAVAKPPGVPVHATLDAHRDHLVACVGRLLLRRDGHIGYLGLQHRLDVDTSGIVVFSRLEEANRPLSQAFADRHTVKRYLAVTVRPLALPDETFTVRDHLAPNKRGKPPMISVRSGGDAAWTDFAVRAVGTDALLIEARLHTGRRHQIRTHLSGLGLPILGDRDNGPATAHLAARLLLHAWRLTLPHPHTGQPLEVHAPPPLDFRQAAERLGLPLPLQ